MQSRISKATVSRVPPHGDFYWYSLQVQPACTSRDSSEKSFRFALHSSRYAGCFHEETATDSHPVRYSIYVLNAFGREAFQRMPPREGVPRDGHTRFFVALYFRFLFVSRNDFFLCSYTARFPLAWACPSCRGRHYLSLRSGVKAKTAKGHLWNPFGERFPTMQTKASRKALQ